MLLTVDIINTRLRDRRIQIIGTYTNSHTKTQFKCLKDNCGNIWLSAPTHILHQGLNCPKCSGRKLINNEVIDRFLIDKSIKRVGNCGGGHTKVEFQCSKEACGYIWSTKPNNILNSGSGCPKCAKTL